MNNGGKVYALMGGDTGKKLCWRYTIVHWSLNGVNFSFHHHKYTVELANKPRYAKLFCCM